MPGRLRCREGGAVRQQRERTGLTTCDISDACDDLVRELRAHRENPQVKAVVIRVNSPGGVVGPTQELHQAIMRVREAGKPVVASLGSIAASGGYYTAVAADRIFANPGTLTGSIGVIMQMANVADLFKKVGVDYVVVKAGQYKDLGNFSRPMTAEERRVLAAVRAGSDPAVQLGYRRGSATGARG